MVLAIAFEPDVAQQDDFVIAFDFLEGPLQQADRIDLVAGEQLAIGAGDAGGRVAQALARRVVAGPAEQDADGVFGFRLGWCPIRSSDESGDASGGVMKSKA